jgi:hypothetical protein
MVGFGGGGNLILDTAVWLAAWWGLGSTIAGLTAWPYMCKS